MQKINLYECEYCCKRYVDLNKFEKHTCKYSKRALIVETSEFKSAFALYKRWRKTNGYTLDVKPKNFIMSKYFVSFIKFSDFNKRMGIPDIQFFMTKMKELNMVPSFWSSNEIYERYIAEYDNEKTPMEMAKVSVDTIFSLSNIFECEPNKVLYNLTSCELIRLVHARKLTPWVLLLSKSFFIYLSNKLSPIERITVGGVIDVDYWKDKFKKDPISLSKIKKVVNELGI